MNKMQRSIFILAKSFFDMAVFFATAFLGAYLGRTFDKPIDTLGWYIIGIVIASFIIKGVLDIRITNLVK